MNNNMRIRWGKDEICSEKTVEIKHRGFCLKGYEDGDIILSDDGDNNVLITKEGLETLKKMYHIIQLELEKTQE